MGFQAIDSFRQFAGSARIQKHPCVQKQLSNNQFKETP